MQTRRSFLESLAVIGVTPLLSIANKNFPFTQKQFGISFLELVANNLDAQERFYTNIMELPVARINAKKIRVRAGTTEIYFYEDKNYTDPIYHFAFNIPENKLEEGMSWLKKKKVILAKNSQGGEIYDFRNWNAHSIYWQDAAGNILEFIARHNLPNATARPFSTSDILYASEIGLVVDNVGNEMKYIKDILDLDPYRSYAPNFAAIGNEHNLIILVEKNRPWLGSSANIPAKIFPVTTNFKSGAKSSRMNFKDYPFSVATQV